MNKVDAKIPKNKMEQLFGSTGLQGAIHEN